VAVGVAKNLQRPVGASDEGSICGRTSVHRQAEAAFRRRPFRHVRSRSSEVAVMNGGAVAPRCGQHVARWSTA